MLQMDGVARIPLTRGLFATVDADDFLPLQSQGAWHAFGNAPHVYAARHVGPRSRRRIVLMHRAIIQPDGKLFVDHINGDGLDNRRENLRACTHSENMMNRRTRTGSSRFKGVYRPKGRRKWEVGLRHNKRRIFGGTFDCEIQAAKRYDELAREHFGEFARLNFPEHVS